MAEGRTCTMCGEFKSPEEFGKDKRTKNGLKAKCRLCEKEYMRQYHLAHKEEFNQKSREYRQEHREELNRYSRKHYQENKERYAQYQRDRKSTPEGKLEHATKQREWYHKNNERAKAINRRSYRKHREKRRAESRRRYREKSDEYKARAAQYRRENMDRVLQWNRERKIRKLEVPGTHTLEQWLELCEFFDRTCPCCGQEADFTVDHIVPLSWEGTSDWITNIQPLCKPCNCSKHASHAMDYRPEHVKEWAEAEKEKCQQ